MDVNLNELRFVIMAYFVLHNFCEIKNETFPQARLEAVVTQEKRSQHQSSITYGSLINDNIAIKKDKFSLHILDSQHL